MRRPNCWTCGPPASGFPKRRGLAELELIMVLPIILGFVCIMLWIGLVMRDQCQAIVVARHSAWLERAGGEQQALRFADENVISRTAERSVEYFWFAKGLRPTEATQSVIGGSWDHRQLNLNRSPNLKVLRKLMSNSGSDAMSAFDNLLNQLPDLSNQLSGLVTGFQNEMSSAQSQLYDAMDTARKKVQESIDQMQKQVEDMQKQVQGIDQGLNQNQSQSQKNEDRIKQLDQEAKRDGLTDDKKKEIEKMRKEIEKEQVRLRKEQSELKKQKENLAKELNQSKGLLDGIRQIQ